MNDGARAAEVVRFWRMVEMFTPQDVPKRPNSWPKPKADQHVLDLRPGDLAPWQEGHWIRRVELRQGMTWQFTVYGGLYELSAVRDELVRVFGRDAKEPDGRLDGRTALLAFTVDDEGGLVENSATLSACAWAISRTHSPGSSSRGWLDGFEKESREFARQLDQLVPPSARKESPEGVAAEGGTVAAKVKRAAADQVKNAATEALKAGAKSTGAAVTTAAAAAVGSLAGPVVGGIAGSVAGTFAEKVLTPRKREQAAANGSAGAAEEDGVSGGWPCLTVDDVHRLVSALTSELGLRALKPSGVRVKCTQVSVRAAAEAGEQNFLNSFIANDLGQIEKDLRSGNAGAGLVQYLTDPHAAPPVGRIDVRAEPAAVAQGVSPRDIPTGRWPTDVTKPLVLSQQFAVNRIFADLDGRDGLFAVNGPPGTGKTTMLRDVLAAIVVRRAEQLTALHHPVDGFTRQVGSVALNSKHTAYVFGVRPELAGSEIVLATANNTAAENVTAEIPGVNAVRGALDEALEADYFADLASHILDAPAWGLLAATLGNKNNRRQFASRFWWGDGKSQAGTSEGNGKPEPQKKPVGMREILLQAQRKPETAADWAGAVKRFKDAAAEVARLTAERQEVADAVAAHSQCRAARDKASDQVVAATQRREHARGQLGVVEQHLASAQTAFAEADVESARHAMRQPGFWVQLSTLFKAGRVWASADRDLNAKRTAAKQERDRIRRAVGGWQTELSEATEARQSAVQARDEAERVFVDVCARIAAGRARWPGAVPFLPDFDDDDFQRCAPWADHEFTSARNRLFLEALRLHKKFVLGAEPRLRDNLAAIEAYLKGRVKPEPAALLAAWQALFLVVPVVSTTFASLPRLLAGLGREALGWLFIDEAGQATPQEAVGGIWRARRSVIVGDPRQLEPIVSLPSSAQEVLRRHCRVDLLWSPDTASAQQVADRTARYGTELADADGSGTAWVGAPLRVHRRCDRLMFGISNDIAYGGTLMVYGTRHDGEFPGRNRWIHVPSGASDEHWLPAEGDALTELLQELSSDGVAAAAIRVASPFRAVVRGARTVGRRVLGEEFAAKNVGTVHTMQGQESDVVVLVLGTAAHRERAREWAAEKPNLLNVAVSRAKRRLYVIGDRQNWRTLPYFSVLAERLPGGEQ
ncbi:DEAD/DEAH box helicase [Amycolatopsis benzoatilytica]|uniref:DEAD/DEAH box helicase n=1 Tax=Amycolatopsis benzoatilytica TaxID=346045 RepID=UPI000362F627|nr:DEAD/DEAH box helicase [Amycolatopsis benzoatilytica]